MPTTNNLLYLLSKTHSGGALISWIFRNMNFALPLNYLHETSTLLAFYHPKPSHTFHVVLVPKRQIASLEDLSSNDQVFFSDLFSTVRTLVSEYNLTQGGYRLIVNGGKFQEFGLLHFHLISDKVQENN